MQRRSTGLLLALATASLSCKPATPEGAAPRDRVDPPEVRLTTASPDTATGNCGLTDYPAATPTDIHALVLGQAAGEKGVALSHLVVVRYRLDETGRITHLKLVRPSSYGVRVTEQALDALKGRRLAPFLVHGKPTPVCVDTAITPDVR